MFNGVHTFEISLIISKALERHSEQERQSVIKKDTVVLDSSEANPAVGPFRRIVYLEDVYGTHYKIVAEELKKVKDEGWITFAEADKLNIHWDKEEQIYVKNTPEYEAWLYEERVRLSR
jgi:hypothetical protein|tara:strand:- start:51 stop:407 length:357 start_codon:yes stop_codon:yes gene_type:complete